ncbi:hypothetical protein TESG_02336 [Trichophyton tonsurans CBS 112818]|uniref:Uncharacterized protein n=1 Tax=Trichophyton tonsurans (strain CBS 112818) TaxID=647933 RepID=F2RU35_TRIT1|nr:hypothetical protein TESG_02336 [Trichophyton tonsurans CBS 112818]
MSEESINASIEEAEEFFTNIVHKPQKRQLRVGADGMTAFDRNKRPTDMKLCREARWLYLLSFQKMGIDSLVKTAYEDADSYEFSSARTALLEAIKGWKCKTLFTAEKFFIVFYWAAPIVDYDKSSEKGKWYLRNVYANLAAEVKLYLDLVERSDSMRETNSCWDEIRDLWDVLGDSEDGKVVAGAMVENFMARKMKAQIEAEAAEYLK